MNKIMFVITGLDHAGAEMQVLELASGLYDRGWLIQVVSLLRPTLDLRELESRGIVFKTLDMRKGVPDPRAMWRLRKMIKQFAPDVVHSHMIHANLLARFTRLCVSVPMLVSTAHNTNEGGKLWMLLYRITDFLCELTTNVSQEAVNSYIEKKASPQRKIRFVPNGINLSKFAKRSEERAAIRRELKAEGRFVWLAVGRLTAAKDYPTLLKAWARVKQGEASEQAMLLIVGDGEQRAALQQMMVSLDVESSVRFLGIRSDIPRLMATADCYVMSSLWEGMPMVLLESAACELPAVATDVGGNREVVQDGVSGLLARPADEAHLAERMNALMSLPEEARLEMGSHGRKYVMEHFALDAVIAKWESLYRQLDKRKQPLTRAQGGVV